MARQGDTTSNKPKRGFAAMSPERRREIAAKGGAAVPAEKRSFSRSRDLAAQAGRAGGSAPTKGRGKEKA
ncbi:KGG domain-containing protein [Caulobacter sp.]|uniref:KGG domain-containing protein n=1 Tax=Caulobacter sp. TaxID=78 RepID=UPI001B055E90|nr:KGG domain-containing protein [Caulobacter sp.]MBO9545795.1 stress-induced protein [Caulobacter sp.]